MRFRKRSAILALLLAGIWGLSAAPAAASNATAGQIIGPLVDSTGFVIFYHNGTRTGDPACDTNGRWGFSAATAGGQAMLSMLMTAFASNRQIVIYGTGTCTNGQENIAYFFIP